MEKAINYYSFCNPAKHPICNHGSKVVPVYQMQRNKKGDTTLVQTGTRDMYAIIQSHKNSTDINYILERAKNDPNYLNSSTAQYLDLTKMPNNIFEAAEMIQKAEQSFMDLPLSLREKYNHNPYELIKAQDKGVLPEDIKAYIDSQVVKNNPITKPLEQDPVDKGVVVNGKE